jgi:hypothetical protein
MSTTTAPLEYPRTVHLAYVWTLGYVLLAFLFPGAFAFVAVYGSADFLAAGLALIVPLLGTYLNVRSLRSILRRQGYPKKYWEVTGWSIGHANRVMLIAATIAATFAFLSARWSTAAAVSTLALVFILVFQLVGPLEVYNTVHDVHMMPYFESKINGSFRCCICNQVIRHMEELDDLARSHRVTPLSDFGWNDELKGVDNVWHDPWTGLKTVNVLLSHYELDEFTGGSHAGMASELKELAQALSQAADRQVRFCLLLFCGEATNDAKESRRKGFFN